MLRLFYEKYLPVIFWPVFLIAISWVTYRIVMMPEKIDVSEFQRGNENESIENIPIRSYKPRISQVSEDGTVRWVLSSEEIVGVVGGRIQLKQIMVLFTLDDNSTLNIVADSGVYDDAEKHLSLEGGIKGEYPSIELNFSCDAIDYFQADKQLSLSGDVNFDAGRDGVRVACPEVNANLANKLSKVDFLGGVEVDLYKMK